MKHVSIKKISVIVLFGLISLVIIFLKPATNTNIVIAAIPKSGSTYLLKSLQLNLGYTRHRLIKTYKDSSQVAKGKIHSFFAKKSVLDKSHFRSPINYHTGSALYVLPVLQIPTLKRYSNKLVVHVRDPRQILISLLHHIDNNVDGSSYLTREIKAQYPTWTFEEKIAWGIVNIYPSIVAWIDDWILYKQQQDKIFNGMQILFTTYEEMVLDDQQLYNKILSFYEIPKTENFSRPAKDKGVLFRKGDPQEFRQIYTKEQLDTLNAMIPTYMLEYFNWSN